MVKVKVRQTGHIKAPKLDGGRLTRIGNQIVAEQKARWQKHKNAYGNEAKPLSKRYTFIKKKQRGLGRPYRDQNLTGVLIQNFILRKAINNEIRAENTSRAGRQHARQAQKYEEMIGFSGPEQVSLYRNVNNEYAGQLKTAWIPVHG